MLRRFGLSFAVAVAFCVFGAVAGADAATPVFVYATPTFTNPDLVVTFKEKGLGRHHQVTYQLNGVQRTVYSCADGSNTTELDGPILDESSGGSFGSTPPTKTYTSNRSGVIVGSFTQPPLPAIDAGSDQPITCANGASPVLVLDEFKSAGTSDPSQLLSVLDVTHNLRKTMPGTYGFCDPGPWSCP